MSRGSRGHNHECRISAENNLPLTHWAHTLCKAGPWSSATFPASHSTAGFALPGPSALLMLSEAPICHEIHIYIVFPSSSQRAHVRVLRRVTSCVMTHDAGSSSAKFCNSGEAITSSPESIHIEWGDDTEWGVRPLLAASDTAGWISTRRRGDGDNVPEMPEDNLCAQGND